MTAIIGRGVTTAKKMMQRGKVWPQKYETVQCEQNSVSHNIKGYWSIFWVTCRLSCTSAVKKGISTRLVGSIMTYSLPFLVEFQQSFCCGKKSLCHLFASHVLQYCYTFIIKHLRWKQKDFLGSLKAFEMLWCMRKIFYILSTDVSLFFNFVPHENICEYHSQTGSTTIF